MAILDTNDFLKNIKRNPENYYLIHYSCQSLYDDNEGLSPRITSIAISHYATYQTVSFSTHAIAEELKIKRENVIEKFDEIEKRLLADFYNFVRDRRDKFWIHWNMKNLTYGFEHIQHRFRILSDENPPVIPVERRINLSEMLISRYGSGYAKHPRMKCLMEMNGGMPPHFLNGKEEVEAFKKHEFINMHNSTLCKLEFFNSVIRKMIQGKLKTASRGFGIMLDRLFETRTAKIISLMASITGLAAIIIQIISYLRTYISQVE